VGTFVFILSAGNGVLGSEHARPVLYH
jgi:hypothetical protein